MMSVNDFFLGIVSLVLWRITFANTHNLKLYEQKFTSYTVMEDYYIFHTSSSASAIICSAECTKDQDCMSFMFDAETTKCTAFSDYVQCESGENMQHFYVKAERQPKLLCACNLAYNSSFVNVALGKNVTQSSMYHHMYYGGLMVDGNRSHDLPCTHTLEQRYPYAIIDLEQSYNVYSFYIVNRFDEWYIRLHHLKIFVGNDLTNLSLCIDYPPTIGKDCTLRVPTPCQGRYVKLLLNAKAILTICEIEVYSVL